MDEPLLVEVLRSGMVESRHRGSAVGLAADGSSVLELGNPARPVYGRSANKPMQAIAMVELGLDLEPELLALVCASHNGEPAHVVGVRRILASAGLHEDALHNSRDYPLHGPSAHNVIRAGESRASILQNCSGKHAGMLKTCVVCGWPIESYLDLEHPLQRHITTVIERLAGEPAAHVGVDGCGAPAHMVSLIGLARAFAAIARAEPGTPAATVYAAMRAHPEMVGGTGRDITALITGVRGLVAKDGAEGVIAGGLPDGRAVAIKLADGSSRGLASVMLAALERLGVDVSGASALRSSPVLGGGRAVGEAQAVSLA